MNTFVRWVCLCVTVTCIFYLLIETFNSMSSKNPPVSKDLNKTEMDYWNAINVDTMTAEQIIDYFRWGNHKSCEYRHYFGGFLLNHNKIKAIDGQYPVCLDEAVKPSSNKRRCIVYSFGISYDWSFDEGLEEFGCEIFSFDPSMDQADHDHSQHIHFYKIGLGPLNTVNDRNWKLMTLDSIYQMLVPRHGAHIIDYLKIDIEWSEWDALEQIIKSKMLNKVRQLTVEFHFSNKQTAESRFDMTLDGYRSLVHLVKSIEKLMTRFDSRPNIWSTLNIENLNHYNGPMCFEISFYQVLPAGGN